jgi:acetyl esterase
MTAEPPAAQGSATADAPLLPDGSVGQLRQFMDSLSGLPEVPFDGTIEDLTIPTRSGSVPARRYQPVGLDAPAPVFVFLHGGGFVAGSIDSHDNVARELAIEARAQVISVDYRLAPEHPYPAAVHDAVDATAWVVASADELGIDPTRLGTAGDSAGAGLATAVALHSRDNDGPTVALQLLVYPKIDFVGDHPSHHEPVGEVGITAELAALFDRSYLPDASRRAEPLASPLAAPDLSNLPPTIVVSAERDTLRDEAERYGQRLHQAGVTVATVRAVGLPHGFLNTTTIVEASRLFARTLYAGAGVALRGER